MSWLLKRFMDLLFGPTHEEPHVTDAVPASIRAASHEQSNAASALRGATMRLKRDVTALEKLAERIKEQGD